ncbi:MAG: hypothetical protein VX257_04130 [Planctomycetota bacterium]|nr:hypothetical protein [Planctomycetota bacterium]
MEVGGGAAGSVATRPRTGGAVEAGIVDAGAANLVSPPLPASTGVDERIETVGVAGVFKVAAGPLPGTGGGMRGGSAITSAPQRGHGMRVPDLSSGTFRLCPQPSQRTENGIGLTQSAS